jgi:hypothetical protein
MPNKQPFYHRAVILFTATEPLDQADVLSAITEGMPSSVIPTSIEIEEFDEPQAGDPADLM